MSTIIYIVVKNEGEYEDFRTYNLKAFYNKRDAEEYIREINPAKDKLPFVTENFENAVEEAEFNAPDFEGYPYFPILTDEDRIKYNKWYKDQENKHYTWIINTLKEEGIDITLEDLYNYYNYLDEVEYDYYIETIELE